MSASSFNRPGAVDLSQLTQQARAGGPGPAGAGRAAGGGASPGSGYVVQVAEATFEAEVIQKSLKHPVVVELYSPRVATGQQLSDALAAVASESAGRFLLARVNVDGAPQIVQALQIQAVPTVIAVIGGQLAPLFQGVIPKEQVQAAIEQVLQAAVANGIVGRAEPVAGGPDSPPSDPAEQGPDPRFAAADEALARNDFAAAAAEFDKLLQANPNDAEARAGKAQAGLFARVVALDPGEVTRRATEAPTDLGAQFDAADLDLSNGEADLAFNRLLDLVRNTSGAEREQARLRLLELFETLGNEDPRVLKARRGLMSALF